MNMFDHIRKNGLKSLEQTSSSKIGAFCLLGSFFAWFYYYYYFTHNEMMGRLKIPN